MGMDSADVFANDTDKKQLNGGEKENTDHHRCCSDLELVPVYQLINKIAYRHQEADDG